jgi:hypothetical protein
MFWIGIFVALALLLVWFFIVRPLLAEQPKLAAAFAAEASFIDKTRAKITGWRTKIVARLIAIAATVVGLYDQVVPLAMGQDWTPITAKIPSWTLPIGMLAVSFLIVKLKDMTQRAPQLVTAKDDAGQTTVVNVVRPDGVMAVDPAKV